MTWIQFSCWITGIYTLYYAGNILTDLFFGQSVTPDDPSPQALTFEEPGDPELIEHVTRSVNVDPPAGVGFQEPVKDSTALAPEILSSGGVLLDELVSLAQEELIVFSRPISY